MLRTEHAAVRLAWTGDDNQSTATYNDFHFKVYKFDGRWYVKVEQDTEDGRVFIFDSIGLNPGGELHRRFATDNAQVWLDRNRRKGVIV